MPNDLHNVRSRLRETPAESPQGKSPVRRFLDQHRGVVEWLTTPVGKRLYRPSRT